MIRKTKVAVSSKSLHRERWRDFLEVVFLVVILAIFIRSFLLGVYRISTNSMAPALVAGDFIWASKIAYGIKIPFSNYKLFQKIPQKGDVVVVQFLLPSHSTKKIMRVMAHPGDHIEFKDHQPLINGKALLSDLGRVPQKKSEGMVEESFSPKSNKNSLMPKNQKLVGETILESSGSDVIFKIEKNDAAIYTVQSQLNPTQSRRLIPLIVPPGEVFVMLDNRSESTGDTEVRFEEGSSLWSLIRVEQIESQVRGIWFSLAWPASNYNPAFNSSNTSEGSEARLRWERVGTF